MENHLEWTFLIVAGLFETAWAIGLKYTMGFTQLWPSIFTVFAMGASFILLSKSVEILPIGTAYAVWTGIGAVGTAILGIFLFGESAEFGRILCLLLIIGGIVGLRVLSV